MEEKPGQNSGQEPLDGLETSYDEEGLLQKQTPRGRILPVLISLDQQTHGTLFVVRKKHFQVGRSSISDLVIEDSKTSRNHAHIEYVNILDPFEPPECVLYDDLSRNGTFLNGEKVTEPRQLKNGDQVIFGRAAFWYYTRSEVEIKHEENLKSILDKYGFRPMEEGFCPMAEAGLEIVFQDRSFEHGQVSGTLEFASLKSFRVITGQITREIYSHIIQGTNHVVLTLSLSDGEKRDFRCLVSWLHFDNRKTPPMCILGLSPEKIRGRDRKFLEKLMMEEKKEG